MEVDLASVFYASGWSFLLDVIGQQLVGSTDVASFSNSDESLCIIWYYSIGVESVPG